MQSKRSDTLKRIQRTWESAVKQGLVANLMKSRLAIEPEIVP
jgi:hypothetical protein